MSSAAIRNVDRIPVVTDRPVPMQVLCLGLSRTSTMTMCVALGKLGYRSYHFVEVSKNQTTGNKHFSCWIEGMTAKIYGKGESFGRVEFDKLLQDYSAVADAPCANYYKELQTAYSDAKVILTTRDPNKWIQSMEVSILYILLWRIWSILNAVNYLGRPGPKALRDLLELIVIDWSSGHPNDRDALRHGFIAHNENVRSVTPKENLLEFTFKDGWEPLCKFLGKEVPNEPFPYVNKGGNTANLIKAGLVITYVKHISRPALIALVAWFAYKWISK